jgi:hypothetical protein
MLKKFADSAPCNYSHQYILVEVQPSHCKEKSDSEEAPSSRLTGGCWRRARIRPSSRGCRSGSEMR